MIGNTRKTILSRFLCGQRATATELTEILSVSRTTVLKDINLLIEEGIVAKDGKHYGINKEIATVMIKLCGLKGEIVGYSFVEGLIDRKGFSFSEMETYGENLLGFVKRAEMYADFLKRRYSRVILCLIYDSEAPLSVPLPDIFSAVYSREELYASVLGEQNDGLSLCIANGRAFICDGKRPLNCFKPMSGSMESYLDDAVRIIAPGLIFIEDCTDLDRADAEEVCRKAGIRLIVSDENDLLRKDESEMLLRALANV